MVLTWYFSFAKYGVKAGCLCCKDLLESGSSLLNHLQICPRVTGHYDAFDSDSHSKDHVEFTMDPGLMVDDVDLPAVMTISGAVPLK